MTLSERLHQPTNHAFRARKAAVIAHDYKASSWTLDPVAQCDYCGHIGADVTVLRGRGGYRFSLCADRSACATRVAGKVN